MTVKENDELDDNEVLPVEDSEVQAKKYKFPRSIGFIVSNEFCERFTYYGMRTILSLYFTQKLLYEEDTATFAYHTFTALVYVMCVFGAMVADSWLGKYRTIVYLSIVYVFGCTILAVGAIETLSLPMEAFTIIGLLLIAIGSGGIKPCVAAFGGDQFKLPEQVKQVGIYFSIFYFAINSGSFVSTTVTPILRADVHCFDQNDCFSLAFGVPAMLMAVSIVIFICGKFLYKIKDPAGNMMLKCAKCIKNALSVRRKEKKTNPKEHWLEYAVPVHGEKLVEEVKAVLKVLFLYIPLPMFWALFDQQGSRWTFQATRMDGALSDSFTVKPDQMQVVNPILILIFIPLYRLAFYPLLAKVGIRRPLQKMCLGGILAGVAFVVSGILELELEKTYPVLPEAGQTQIRIYNSLECDVTFINSDLDVINNQMIQSVQHVEFGSVPVTGNTSYTYSLNGDPCGLLQSKTITLYEEESVGYFINNHRGSIQIDEYLDDPSKSRNGLPLIRVLANVDQSLNISFKDTLDDDLVAHDERLNISQRININPSKYQVYLDNNKVSETLIELRLGGVYTLLITKKDDGSYETNTITVTSENTVHMFWIIPQYVIMTLGEVMYSVTGLEFSYSQAPPTMKSVLQGGWQLTVGVGNIIVAIIAESIHFGSQSYEFFLFALLMFIDMLIFGYLAYRYVPVTKPWEGEEADDAAPPVKAVIPSLTDKQGVDNNGFKED